MLTYAAHLYRACGGDLEVVQEQLGHASAKTTTIYAKLTKQDKLRAANALAKTYRESKRGVRSAWMQELFVRRANMMSSGDSRYVPG